MEILEAREKTYKANKDKKAWPKNNSAIGKYFEPSYLAQLGFYHTPQPNSNVVVTCVNCNKVCDWKKSSDHPIQYHLKHEPCYYVRLWGGVECDRKSNDWKKLCDHSETLKDMKTHLKESFRGLVDWPYGPDKDQKHPTADEIAIAGFCFMPSNKSDDRTICPYCEVSIDSWEESDDPMYFELTSSEHESRNVEFTRKGIILLTLIVDPPVLKKRGRKPKDQKADVNTDLKKKKTRAHTERGAIVPKAANTVDERISTLSGNSDNESELVSSEVESINLPKKAKQAKNSASVLKANKSGDKASKVAKIQALQPNVDAKKDLEILQKIVQEIVVAEEIQVSVEKIAQVSRQSATDGSLVVDPVKPSISLSDETPKASSIIVETYSTVSGPTAATSTVTVVETTSSAYQELLPYCRINDDVISDMYEEHKELPVETFLAKMAEEQVARLDAAIMAQIEKIA